MGEALDFITNLIDAYALLGVGAFVGFICGYIVGVTHATKVPVDNAKSSNSAFIRGNNITVIQKGKR